jgi:hypothetical protein
LDARESALAVNHFHALELGGHQCRGTVHRRAAVRVEIAGDGRADLRGLLRLVPGQQSGVVHLVEQTALAWLESVECGRDCTVADAVEREGQLVVVPVVIGALVEHEVGVLLDDGGHVVLLVEVQR